MQSSPFANQLLLIDKPIGWTSFDVVKKVRQLIRNKVGHAGTLDPLASGLLILCTGTCCKQVETLMNLDKEYEVVLMLGATTASYDLETEPQSFGPYDHITAEAFQQVAQCFVGTLLQQPPPFSAKYVEGKRAYQLARAGKKITVPAQPVTLHWVRLDRFDPPQVSCTLCCGKGFYVRSFVHDVGQQLGCGAYVHSLRRTRIGPYEVCHAWQIHDFEKFVKTHQRNGLSYTG